jgi:methylated-DNA-[protein]-cysteine S-methyltransferase
MTDLERRLRGRTLPPSPPVDLGGEADVVYADVDSPVGPLRVAATRRGLLRVAYAENDPDAVLDRIAARVSPRVVEAAGRLDDVRRQLDDYFEGRRRHFDLEVDWSLVRTPFGRQVLEACAAIPFGATDTYRGIAVRIGRPAASRATGNALGANPVPIVVPCHRVLTSGGRIGGYTGGVEKKERLLHLEGLLIC